MKRLTSTPTAIETPPDVLRAVRAVHPRAEVVYIGDGKWWLGIVEDVTKPFMVNARTRLCRQMDEAGVGKGALNAWDGRLSDRLAAEGFSFFGEYTHCESGELVEELQLMLSVSEKDLDLLFERNLEEIDGTAARRRMVDRVRASCGPGGRGREATRRWMRKRMTLPVNGLKPAKPPQPLAS